MDNELRKTIDDAILEKTKFQSKVDNITKDFYDHTEPVEILKIIEIVIQNSHPGLKNTMKEFKTRYENDCLELEDMRFYLDMYEKHKSKLKNC